MTIHPESVWKRREELAVELAGKSKGFREIGAAWGTSHVYAWSEIRKRWPSLHKQILDRPNVNALPAEVGIERCRALVKHKGCVAKAAREVGIEPTALHQWIKDNAPDGPELFLEDYDMEDVA